MMASSQTAAKDPRAEGRRANAQGMERAANPYPRNTIAWVEWHFGWTEEENHDDL